MQRVHINTVKLMLQQPDPVDLVVYKQSGELAEYKNCVSTSYNRLNGTRNIRLLSSGQVRRLRDVFIYSINGMEVFL